MPATFASSPVVMSDASTGVYSSLASIITWSRMLPEPWPPRFQYEWCARLTQVALSLVASMSTTSSLEAFSV